jgi:signal transduction histidine kinase
VASHELKTPLTALSLHLDALLLEAGILSQGAPALSRFQDKLNRSINHAGRLGWLLQQLLDVSRIQMGKLELQLEMVDLGKLVEEVAGRFMEQAAQAGCSLKVAPPPQPVMGYWDPLQLDRVTTNLISNAVKYGAGKPVEIAITADGGKATLSVKDQGIGISPADQKRIFQRFVRAVSQRHYGGLGLGLWITRQALEAMGGSVRVQSTPSVETVFVAELPLRTAPSAT